VTSVARWATKVTHQHGHPIQHRTQYLYARRTYSFDATGALKRCLQQRADRLIGDDDPALSCGGCQVIPCGRKRLAQGRSASRHRGDDGIEEFA